MGVITSREWPPVPVMRITLLRYWHEGHYGFWVEALRETRTWIPPWYGSFSEPWEYASSSYAPKVISMEVSDEG